MSTPSPTARPADLDDAARAETDTAAVLGGLGFAQETHLRPAGLAPVGRGRAVPGTGGRPTAARVGHYLTALSAGPTLNVQSPQRCQNVPTDDYACLIAEEAETL